jgi:hypothetical protein
MRWNINPDVKIIITLFLCIILCLSFLYSCNNNDAGTIQETSAQDTSAQDMSDSNTFIQDSIIYDTSVLETAPEVQGAIGGNTPDNGCIHDMLDEDGFVINDPFYESFTQ